MQWGEMLFLWCYWKQIMIWFWSNKSIRTHIWIAAPPTHNRTPGRAARHAQCSAESPPARPVSLCRLRRRTDSNKLVSLSWMNKTNLRHGARCGRRTSVLPGRCAASPLTWLSIVFTLLSPPCQAAQWTWLCLSFCRALSTTVLIWHNNSGRGGTYLSKFSKENLSEGSTVAESHQLRQHLG